MLDITEKTFIAAAKAVVKRVGEDFVYQPEDYSCVYVHGIPPYLSGLEISDEQFETACPGCFIGSILMELGVTPLEIVGRNGVYNLGVGSSVLLDRLVRNEVISLPDAVYLLASKMQRDQDCDVPWSGILNRYEVGIYK